MCGIQNTIFTPIIVIGNIVAFGLIVAALFTPMWYSIEPIFHNNATDKNITYYEEMGALMTCVVQSEDLKQIVLSDNTSDLACLFKIHSSSDFEACGMSSGIDMNNENSCKATQVAFFLLYIAFFLNLISGVLTGFMCCTKCISAGTCGNSFSCIGMIPTWIGFVVLLLAILISAANTNYYASYMSSYGFTFPYPLITVNVHLGASFYVACGAMVVTLIEAIAMSWDAKDSILECCCNKQGPGEYHLM